MQPQRNQEEVHVLGFSLLESLLGLMLFSLLFLAGLAFFNFARMHFHVLKDAYETEESLHAAADKIKLDLEAAGLGLCMPLSRDLLKGIFPDEGHLVIQSLEHSSLTPADLQIGQTRIAIADSSPFRVGRTVCFFDQNRGECRTVESLGPGYIILEEPLADSYPADHTQILLIKRVEYYLDTQSRILRRKVNTSSAQPLLEDTDDFSWSYDESNHLTAIYLKIHTHKEKSHALSLRPKNLALSDLQKKAR